MRMVGVHTGPATHLDHLGVLCHLLKIPLFVSCQNTFAMARKFYPMIDVHWIDHTELSLSFLAAHYDFLLGCGKFWTEELRPAFEHFHQKKMRFVFCPHGNSDKGRTLRTTDPQPRQDIALIYGDHMLELLRTTGALSHIEHVVVTGNYRYAFYRQHQNFYDKLAEEYIWSHFIAEKPTILYAPTWPDKENPSLCFDLCHRMIAEHDSDFHLLIKLHPLLEERYPAQVYHLLGQYTDTPNVHILLDFPVIYPILQRADLYLGDFSSIGYDFLAFDKPLYFLHPPAYPTPISACGVTLPLDSSPYPVIKATLKEHQLTYSHARQTLYRHAFGKERDMEHVRQELLQCSV